MGYRPCVRRLLLLAGLAIVGFVASEQMQSEALAPTARLTIRAQGSAMEFRSLGLPSPAFRLSAGSSRTWKNLPPGTYVVVQAPPVGVATQVAENEWSIEGGLQISCSDGESSNEYVLTAGERLTCTFTAIP